MKKILLLFIMILSTCLYSQDGFQYVTTSKDGTDYYYQISSDIDSNMGLYTDIWLKYNTQNKKVKAKSGKYITKKGNSILSLMRISCFNKSFIIKNSFQYSNKGSLIKKDEPFMTEQPIPPGSVIDNIYQVVCRKE